MYIEKIVINNYRIYHGDNTIILSNAPGKNISIISGDNGYGKTTLLTALVWCLYGNQTQDIDEFYREKIAIAGGYKGYLTSSMNRLALSEGETEYYVSISLRGVELPGIQCDTMKITRSYRMSSTSDNLRITIDDNDSELVDDIGQQIFIQDFILPKEIAKFFFFDAEKIVKIAEIQSIQEKRLLSHAYSEVLGMKKYEDLRNVLSDIRIRFKKDSATDDERKQFKDLAIEINRLERLIEAKGQRIQKLLVEKSDIRIMCDEVQEKLLREGGIITVAEMNALRDERARLLEERKTLMNEFRELFEFAPFAIAGKAIENIEDQLHNEDRYKQSFFDKEILKAKISSIISSLENDISDVIQNASNEIKEYYIGKISELMNRHLLESKDVANNEDFEIIHDFSVEERNEFKSLVSNLKTTYRERLQSLNRSLKTNRLAYTDISKKLTDAESIESDELITAYRKEKESLESRIHEIDKDIVTLSQESGALENQLISTRRLFNEVARKVKVNEEYQDKDRLVTRLIDELDDYVEKIKIAKKASLEEKVLVNLNMLMHKKDFIDRVIIEANGDLLDIHLFDKRGNEISKNDLSKGEQQLYASSLLKALIEESGVHFPVFVDSPLQKFDEKHSKNIINSFYPKISNQVVIFPLLNKELSEVEFQLLCSHVNSAFIIDNYNEDASGFREIEDPSKLFDEINAKQKQLLCLNQ
ncbi:MAG: DNA sulfur modification protein DndD [Candidatus Hodarchaeales archaeon]